MSRAARPAIIALASVTLKIALRNVLRQRRRSGIALGAIVFGVIALILSAGYIEWVFWANREQAAVHQFGHIQISRPGFQERGKADPMAYLMPETLEVREVLRSVPGVREVYPRVEFSGLIAHGDDTLTFVGLGVDPDKDPSVTNLDITSGQALTSSDPRGILLGFGLAANLGVKPGDRVVLLVNTPKGGVNALEVYVRGLAATNLKAYDDVMLRVHIDTARELLRIDRRSHLWVATLDRTELTDSVVQMLARQPPLAAYEITPWHRLADFYNKTVELFSRQMGVVKLIIAVIIVLSISNTMSMSVMERTREIGTAMALGYRRRRILSLFLSEGVLLGAVGGFIGVTLGYLLAQLISAIGIPMPPAPGMSRGFIAGIVVTPKIMAEALVLAVSATLIASIYPSWRASRLIIVDALRHNR